MKEGYSEEDIEWSNRSGDPSIMRPLDSEWEAVESILRKRGWEELVELGIAKGEVPILLEGISICFPKQFERTKAPDAAVDPGAEIDLNVRHDDIG